MPSQPHQPLTESSFTTSVPTSKWSEVIWPRSLISVLPVASFWLFYVLEVKVKMQGSHQSHSFYGFRDTMHNWIDKHFPLTLSILIPYTHLPPPHPIHQVKVKSLSRVRLFARPWTVTYQDPPSMGFSRQEYWSGLPFRFPGDLPDPGIEPGSPTL